MPPADGDISWSLLVPGILQPRAGHLYALVFIVFVIVVLAALVVWQTGAAAFSTVA
jgi:hypothetical protein